MFIHPFTLTNHTWWPFHPRTEIAVISVPTSGVLRISSVDVSWNCLIKCPLNYSLIQIHKLLAYVHNWWDDAYSVVTFYLTDCWPQLSTFGLMFFDSLPLLATETDINFPNVNSVFISSKPLKFVELSCEQLQSSESSEKDWFSVTPESSNPARWADQLMTFTWPTWWDLSLQVVW